MRTMVDKKLRIMHGMTEVAGQNMYSVHGLREIGEDAETVVYCEHPFAYSYDKCLHIDKTKKMLFPIYICKLFAFFLFALWRYDCYHFHFGHSILNCIELNLYKKFNKKVFFEFHGSDLRDNDRFCEQCGIPSNPNEKTSPKIHARNRLICKKADGIIIHDDELIPYLPNEVAPVFVVPLRVDVSQFVPFYPNPKSKTIKIVHAPSKRLFKGTKHIIEAFEELKRKHSNIELVLVEGKTQQEALEIYRTADIIIDQVLAGAYGVFSIEGMAMGKPVITYIRDDMKEKLPEELPIVSASKLTIKAVLESLVLDGELRKEIGMAGRKYVENYHDYRLVAQVLRDIYYDKAEPAIGRHAFSRIKELKKDKERKTIQ